MKPLSYLFCAAACAFLCSCNDAHVSRTNETQGSNADGILKVMSYNIHGAVGTDNVFSLDRIADAISLIDPDIAALQEVDRFRIKTRLADMPKHIGERAERHAYFGIALKDQGIGEYGNAIMARDEGEVIAVLQLPVAPEHEARSAIVMRFKDPKPYYVIATHLSWQPELDAEREGMLKAIDGFVREKCTDAPVILCGDLNCGTDRAPIQFLRKNNWKVVNDLAPAFTFPAADPQITLDYIAIFPSDAFDILSFKVDDDGVTSDHRAIYAELKFK